MLDCFFIENADNLSVGCSDKSSYLDYDISAYINSQKP